MNLEKILSVTNGHLNAENSLVFPLLRRYYLKGYRVVLPGNTPDGTVRGLLFCRPSDGKVSFHLYGVHFHQPFRKDCPVIVVKSYLDFVAVKEVSGEIGVNPVLAAASIEEAAVRYDLEGFKVDRPVYGRFLLLPVEEFGGLWKMKLKYPKTFRYRLLRLMEQAAELENEFLRLSEI